MSTLSFIGRDRARLYGKRGGASTAARHASQIEIEGSWYTYQQIAERLGRSLTVAKTRVKAARAHGTKVTWSDLGVQQ